MEFHDNWAFLAFFIYAIGGLICWGIAWFSWETSRKHRKIKAWITGILLFAVGVTVVNLFSWSGSAGSTQDRAASVAEIANEFGFVSGEKYPLVLGDRIDGSAGSGTVSGNFFSVYGSSSTQPASAIQVSFQYNGSEFSIFEFPTSNIKFVQSITETPSMEVYLSDVDSHSYEGAGYDGTSTTYTYGECRVVIVNLWLNCVKPTLEVVTTIDEEHKRDGLSPIIAQHFDSAVITLTPQMYNQLLGKS